MWSKLSIESNTKWEQMPDHLIQLIFSKLPFVNLPACRLVFKPWNHLVLDYASYSNHIPNTFFAFKLHRHKSSPFLGSRDMALHFKESGPVRMHCIDFDNNYLQGTNIVASFRFDPRNLTIRVPNSCNGLLCVVAVGMCSRRACVGILNPMTNEYVELPPCRNSYLGFYFFGFGFGSRTKQYKVVRVSHHGERYGCIVEVFSLGKSREWSDRPFEFLPFIIQSDGVYFNGAVYWVGENGIKFICCFDVDEESFDIIALPKEACSVGIGLFDGNLYAALLLDEHYKFEVWTMRQECSWRKEFVIDSIPRYLELGLSGIGWMEQLQPIKTCEDGKILCLVDKFYLFLYNPKTMTMEALIGEDSDTRTYYWIHQIDSINFYSLDKILAEGR